MPSSGRKGATNEEYWQYSIGHILLGILYCEKNQESLEKKIFEQNLYENATQIGNTGFGFIFYKNGVNS